MTAGLARLARAMNEECAARSSMKVGATIRHPDGRPVVVVSGTFLDPVYGRVSNWWTWKPVLDDGLLGEAESGYGW